MRILLLQGPVGGFFAYLARDLERRGHQTMKIDFNGGDAFFSCGARRTLYRSGHRRWRAWLREFCRTFRPDVMLALGDQRPVHRVARKVAAECGARFFAFEEGYIRPNYVTIEENGNNARSPARTRWHNGEPPAVIPTARTLKLSFKHMSWKSIFYYLAKAAAAPWFPGYLHHRRRGVVPEFFFWNRSYARLLMSRSEDERVTDWLRGDGHPNFFLTALQVHDDLQLLRHGRGWRNSKLAGRVLASFAAHASPACRLVFKVHPYDRGHKNYARRIREKAARHGVADRVYILQSGALAPVIRNARGLITINSTSGIAAIAGGTPVIAFGDAIYSHPSLCADGAEPGALERFWSDPRPPDAHAAKRFIDDLKAHALLAGSYYDEDTWPGLATAVAERVAARAA